MKKISLLIIEDEVLLREGLRSLLEKEDFVRSIYEAGDRNQFLKLMPDIVPDIVLLDIRLKGSTGVELLKDIREMKHAPKVVVVTGLDGIELIINLLKEGVNAIISKLDGYNEIIKAIRAVMSSDTYFPDHIVKIIQNNANQLNLTPPVILTFQEKEMLKSIATGQTTKQMASDLKMSEATAETYRLRLIRKLKVPNTAALLAYAYRNGIL
jgi:DNA-binding NarL/FixJ family response regulator